MPTKDHLIRFEELNAISGVRSRSTLSRLIRTRGFPLPLKFNGGNAAFWREDEVRKWVAQNAVQSAPTGPRA
jgi:predicted DNA-binding transcriptional regulator AlpA